MLQVALLGPLEVRRDGAAVPVPGGLTSELLVRLALEAGTTVRADRLVDDLWGDFVETRRNTLQSKVAKLRRTLGAEAIVTSEDGYRLVVEPIDVDALAVIGDVVAASRMFDEGDDASAAALCATALELFGGEVLPTAGAGDWVTPHRVRLDEARKKLVELQLSARLRLGGAGDVIGDLSAALVLYPYNESLWEMLVTAQYRAGRQADALATYQRVRSLLAEELGLDPGPRLQELEQQILLHDPALGVHSGPVRSNAPEGNLPALSVDLVGREVELAAMADLLASNRLVEIVGPGGVGKTALAIAAGRHLEGAAKAGVWLARLETAITAEDVIDAVVAAFKLGSEAALFERLKGMDALVIIDNCEHVLEHAASLVEHVLAAGPGLRVLCTSQTPLDVDGETIFDLAPLVLDDALELFTRRSAAQRPNRADQDAAVVVELCRSLDGLPLAIELAAARTKTLSLQEIVRRLDDRLSVLSDPTSRRPERRRALRSTIRWSYDLLFPDDQRGLWALATFAGGAPLPAVEAVLAALGVPAAAAIDVVGRLASRSLVTVDDAGAATRVRYRLLDSIRAFALEATAKAGADHVALAAHAAWYAETARHSTDGVRSDAQAEHLSLVRAERSNIDAALAWSIGHSPPLALDIALGFGWAWVVLGESRGAERILAALDAIGDAAMPQDRASALLLAGWIEASTDRLELADAHVAQASEIAAEIDDIDLQARCCYYRAYVVSHRGEFGHALELTDAVEESYVGLDRPWDRAASSLFAARAAISAGDVERSIGAVDRVQQHLQLVQDPWLQVRGEATLGELARLQHRFDDAVVHLGRAAETSGRLGFVQTEAYQVSSLGRAQCQAGDDRAGVATLALAIEKAEATGDTRLAALVRVHHGRVLRTLGDTESARAALVAASTWHRANGGGEQAALGECLLAAIEAVDGAADAQDRLLTALEDAVRQPNAPVEVFALDALARIAAATGDMVTARELCERADHRMDEASHFISDRDRVDARMVRQLA
jgi:predicted ATPase/DNA-binding SARP family transcriptional activator